MIPSFPPTLVKSCSISTEALLEVKTEGEQTNAVN